MTRRERPTPRSARPAGRSPRSTPRSPYPAQRSPRPETRTSRTPVWAAAAWAPRHDHHKPILDQRNTPSRPQPAGPNPPGSGHAAARADHLNVPFSVAQVALCTCSEGLRVAGSPIIIALNMGLVAPSIEDIHPLLHSRQTMRPLATFRLCGVQHLSGVRLPSDRRERSTWNSVPIKSEVRTFPNHAEMTSSLLIFMSGAPPPQNMQVASRRGSICLIA